MRKLLLLLAPLAVVASVFLPPRHADAGPVFSVAMSSSDAGSSQTVQLTGKKCYCLQAKYSETCMKLSQWDGGIKAYGADCTKDFILPQPQVAGLTRMYPSYCFDSAGRTALVVANLDAGPSDTNLYVLELNPANPYGCTTGWGGVGF